MTTGVRNTLIVMLALIAALYAIALPGPFQFDDYATVAVDPGAQSVAVWRANAERHVRPLTKLTFTFSHALGEQLDHVPMGHRLINLLIHLTTVALFYLLGYRIARTCLPDLDAYSAGIVAVTAAALFGLHPLATEAVSYISGRSMALGTLLAATSLWAYIRWRTEAGHLWLITAIVACAGAMLARETAFITPLLWLLWEMTRQQDISENWSAQRLRLCGRYAAVPLIIIGSFATWMLLHDRYAPLLDVSHHIAMNRLTEPSFTLAIQYFASSLALLRYPSIDPDMATALLSSTHRWIIIIILAGLMALAWHTRRTRPHLLLSALWIVLWLAPVYAIPIRYDALAERHFYPAIWGIFYALSIEALLWTRRFRNRQKIFIATADAIALILAVVTLVRVADYRSEVALWEAAWRSAPDKVRVLNNLGYAYMEAGRWDEAHAVLTRAVQLDPRDINAQDNLLTAEEREFGPVRWKRKTD
jgi:hypothetical protein